MGAYSLTLQLDPGAGEEFGSGGFRDGTRTVWATVHSDDLLRRLGLEKIDLIVDVNQQLGGPLRVMLGKQWTHLVAGDGFTEDEIEAIKSGTSVEFDLERLVDPSSWQFALSVRRNAANGSSYISLPRFVVRKLAALNEPDTRYQVVSSEQGPIHSGSSGIFELDSEWVFDIRSSGLKSTRRGWAHWNEPGRNGLESFRGSVVLPRDWQ